MELTQADPAVRTAVHRAAQDGYGGEFCVDGDGAICCRICGVCQPAADATVDGHRQVGSTVLLSVTCLACGERGVALVAPAERDGDARLHAALTV